MLDLKTDCLQAGGEKVYSLSVADCSKEPRCKNMTVISYLIASNLPSVYHWAFLECYKTDLRFPLSRSL